jgi:predicted Zn finger-like uncharacterized protein
MSEKFPCEECGGPIEVSIKQLANDETVVCKKCGTSFKLKDEGGKPDF